KGLLFWTIILPMIFTILFIAIFTANTEGNAREQVILSIVPGYTVMFVFFIMITMVSAFIKDRDLGMTARLASTPLSPRSYLLGKCVPYMVVVLMQIIILFLFGKIIYGIPLEQPWLLLLVSLFLTFTVTGMGLLLAVLVKTENMGIAITQLIALGGALLSGLWIPIDLMPDFLQTIARFLPQYWAHQAYQNAMAGTTHWAEFIWAILILFSFGFIGFLAALSRYPYFLKRARG